MWIWIFVPKMCKIQITFSFLAQIIKKVKQIKIPILYFSLLCWLWCSRLLFCSLRSHGILQNSQILGRSAYTLRNIRISIRLPLLCCPPCRITRIHQTHFSSHVGLVIIHSCLLTLVFYPEKILHFSLFCWAFIYCVLLL